VLDLQRAVHLRAGRHNALLVPFRDFQQQILLPTIGAKFMSTAQGVLVTFEGAETNVTHTFIATGFRVIYIRVASCDNLVDFDSTLNSDPPLIFKPISFKAVVVPLILSQQNYRLIRAHIQQLDYSIHSFILVTLNGLYVTHHVVFLHVILKITLGFSIPSSMKLSFLFSSSIAPSQAASTSSSYS
jgi:hypothetical protein